MGTTRTKFNPDFKAKVALAAIRGEMTINEIASQFGVHGNQVVRWKKQAVAELAEVFSDKREKRHASEEALREELYRQIGQLKVELDWLNIWSLPVVKDVQARRRRGCINISGLCLVGSVVPGLDENTRAFVLDKKAASEEPFQPTGSRRRGVSLSIIAVCRSLTLPGEKRGFRPSLVF